MRAGTIIPIVVALAAVAAVLIFAVIYGTRFKTMRTLRRLTDYEDGYNLYRIDVKYDYSARDILASGYTDTQGYCNALVKDALPLLPVKIELPSYGCSAFSAATAEGGVVMGRNYDFKLNTSCLAVYCSPKDGYRSVAFAALNNIGADKPDTLKAKFACLTAPFICLDGVNEKGVSIAVLTLDSAPTDQNTGKAKITASLIIRMVLDACATTQEAIDLFAAYDMLAVNGRDYHFFITDASGDSRVVEYDPEDALRPMVVTAMPAITNFYAMYADRVASFQRNGVYGHGKERYDYIMDVYHRCNGVFAAGDAWEALKAAATEPNPESVTSNTQWSIVFDNTDPGADIVLRRHWGDVSSFRVEEN